MFAFRGKSLQSRRGIPDIVLRRCSECGRPYLQMVAAEENTEPAEEPQKPEKLEKPGKFSPIGVEPTKPAQPTEPAQPLPDRAEPPEPPRKSWWVPSEWEHLWEIPARENQTGKKKHPADKQVLKEELLMEAIQLHEEAVSGDREAVDEAFEVLEELRDLDPDDPLIEAFYGSTIALLARDSVDPRERLANGLKGHQLLSQAVEKEPDNIWARVLRAFVSFRLPEEYFHRTHIAVEDFEYLVRRYQADPGIFSPEFYWEILYHLGCSHRNLNQPEETRSVWNRLWQETTDPQYRELLERERFQPIEDTAIGRPVPQFPEADPVAVPEPRFNAPSRRPAYETFDRAGLSAGVQLHAQACRGEKGAAGQAHEFFSQLHHQYPDDQLLASYYADSLSMTGRDSGDSALMFANAIGAIMIFEKAVTHDPDDLEIRLLRGRHSYRLPEAFFRRTKTAIEDFTYIARRYEQDHSVLDRETYCQVLHDLAQALQRIGRESESQSVWQKLISQNPDYQRFMPTASYQWEVYQNLARLTSPDQLLQEGINLFLRGVQGDRKSTEKALLILQRAHEIEPENPEIMAYYGSCIALDSKDDNDAGVIFDNTMLGMKMLNQAIGRQPQNPHFRLLRGYLAHSLPESFFHMTSGAIEDFEFVVKAHQQDPSLFPPDVYRKLQSDLAAAYQRVGQDRSARRVLSAGSSDKEAF